MASVQQQVLSSLAGLQLVGQHHQVMRLAGIPQLRFGSFTPGQELLGGEKPCISTKFTIQDMLKSFQTSGESPLQSTLTCAAVQADLPGWS